MTDDAQQAAEATPRQSGVRFLLLAYWPSGSRSFRGCETDRWDSDAQYTSFSNEDDCVNHWAKLLVESEFSEVGCWEIVLVVNGIVVYDGLGVDSSNLLDEDDGEALCGLGLRMRVAAGNVAKSRIYTKRREVEALRLRQEKDARKAAERNEREMLARLKAKYPGA